MLSNTARYVELRGKTYYFRMRVPNEFADVEPLREINRSLKTKDRLEAEARCANVRHALFSEWRARRAGRVVDTRATFDASLDLLKAWGMSFSPMDDLIAGPIDDLLSRIEAIANVDPLAIAVPAALGAIDVPDVTLQKMAERMPMLKANEICAKNARQHREWCGNFKRAARDFTKQIGKRTILTISEQDATNYEAHWKKLAEPGGVTANYANKQIRYVRQMIDAHLEDVRMPDSKRNNVFEKKRVKKLAFDPEDEERKKLPLPERWIRNRLIKDRVLEPMEQEASDIAIIAATGGCRASEIYDVPTSDIHLDHPIPHIAFRIVLNGPERRQLKNKASIRVLVLQGPALAAMRRHPSGFPGHRGKARFSGSVNKFLRENGLFPPVPEGVNGHYVISGICSSRYCREQPCE